MYFGVYSFANQNIEIQSRYPYVHSQCAAYQTEEEPDYTVCISESDIQEEIQINDPTGSQRFPIYYYESLAVYRKIADWMIEHDTILFHGSALSVDGKGFLFTAKSGTGKSTHSRLWREFLGDRVVMINDDKPLLIADETQIYVCGTPWNGKHHLDNNRIVPLHGIAVIHRDTENHIHPIERAESWQILLQQVYHPETSEKMEKVLILLDRIRKNTKIWNLHCNMESEAAEIAFETMWKQKGDNICV